MKITDLKPKTGNIELVATVIHVEPAREFEKEGKKGKVAKATIKDETGECKLTLWNEQTEEVKQGAKIRIMNGWADEYKGEMQISPGKFGKIEVLEHDETLQEAVSHKEKDEKKPEAKEADEEDLYSEDDEIIFDEDNDDII